MRIQRYYLGTASFCIFSISYPRHLNFVSLRVLFQDNNSIYYDPVPEFDMLDPLPEAVMMMKPLPSEEEPPPTVLLSFRPTSGAEAGDKEGDKDKTYGMGEGGDKTDEEIARELHEKLNT